MSKLHIAVLGLAGWLALAPAALGQPRPYIGYVYPAGGQQGTTFQVRVGGQGLDDLHEATVSGKGVTARVVEYQRRMGPLEMTLLREQLQELRKELPREALALVAMATSGPSPATAERSSKPPMTPAEIAARLNAADPLVKLAVKIQKRMAEYVATPACASIATIATIEVTIAPDAEPGPRELTLATLRGVSNPLPFFVGQLPETSRKPMLTSSRQVLGKEELALRNRPEEEVEKRIAVPCTANGQIASGEINRYRFEARQGQRLVIAVTARQLVPYVADAVPGWFQPVLALYDAAGKEVAYSDDYRFKPDPVIFFEVPKDGEYVLTITDAIYRGREDFVYRMSIGEIPFVTSIFPLGGRAGAPVKVEMKGWNLEKAELELPGSHAGPGVYQVAARSERLVSNRVPFALDTLPECREKEPNNDPLHAQKINLPIIINGRVNKQDDWDVFQFSGRAGDTIVAEVSARRLDSPLDSLVKVTDETGKLLALNDDSIDVGSGLNTHHADSYVAVKLPADGTYFVHLGDTARNGGEEYAYRLRISAPEPDFALYTVPSSVAFRSKGSAAITVFAVRKDGFDGPIKLELKDPPAGFSASSGMVPAGQTLGRLGVKTELVDTKEPVTLRVIGTAKIGDKEVVHQVVPAEDRMQAFLWRHLVPAEELKALVFDPSYEPPARRVRLAVSRPLAEPKPAVASADPTAPKPKFTKQQVAGRIRQINLLYEDGFLTEEFAAAKLAECEAVQ